MEPLPLESSHLLYWGFIVLSAFMIAGFAFVSGSRLAAWIAVVWAAVTALIAGSGFLTDFSSMPPRVVLVFLPTVAGVCAIAYSGVGRTLANRSLQFLIGFQSFRIIVELLIHQAVTEGVAPPQMTWSGYNLDILTGVTALVLIPFANKLPNWAAHIWNVMGAGLLIFVVGVAILSMPTAFQRLRPDNTWVAYFPFVWLPVVLVSFALLGHLVLFRKLITRGSSAASGEQ